MNNITVAGRIGRDAEIRHTNSGDAVASFTVADDQGKDKATIWWRCNLWGKRAESLAQYLSKGQAVTVTGQVTEREYERDGETRKSQEIRVNDIALQGGKREEGERQPSRAAPARQPQRSAAPAGGGGFEDMDDDIPFANPLRSRALCLAC